MSESANSKGSESKIFYAVDCMQRALQIAYATNKRGVTPERVSKTLLLLYDTTRTENICAAYRKMAQLALYYSQISESDIANHAEQLAERAADQYPIAVQSILEMAAHLHDKLGNHDAKRRCQLGAVNQTLRMREQVSGAGAEAHWIMKALQALRHIADVTEMEEALENDLRRLQKASIKEMGSFPIELDVSDEREETVNQFSNLTLPEALLNFARISSSPGLDYLKKQALDAVNTTPLTAMIGISHVDEEGKVIRKSESADTSKEPSESWFTNQIAHNEDIRRLYVDASLIDPARQTILSTHSITERHLDPIIACSPFIPDSQKKIWSMGLLRYFQNDYISAAHLLLPQLESSLRHILKLNGISPVKRFDDGTEEDLDLGGMLSRNRNELDKILSANLAAEIERIFHLRPGPALRHDLAHGLLSSGQCSGHNVHYANWLMYKLCVSFAYEYWDKIIAPHLSSLVETTQSNDVIE
ncbi:MAG: hypothetical protein Q7S99_00695 [Parvibaculum sp.]|nr:hypothetical protein [Parvibaculum sp.]